MFFTYISYDNPAQKLYSSFDVLLQTTWNQSLIADELGVWGSVGLSSPWATSPTPLRTLTHTHKASFTIKNEMAFATSLIITQHSKIYRTSVPKESLDRFKHIPFYRVFARNENINVSAIGVEAPNKLSDISLQWTGESLNVCIIRFYVNSRNNRHSCASWNVPG